MSTNDLPKLTILGGSSPFTVELINQFASKNFSQAYHLTLYGRNIAQLNLITDYSRYHLTKAGWQVDCSTDLDDALEGAVIIIHQNRYGGLEGRLEDEQFAQQLGFVADETLGPCGLKSAIRMAPYLKALAQKVLALCPDAIFINLTNPLSIAVSILSAYGAKNAVGVCELPLVTFEKVAQTLGLPSHQLDWDYTGLNHRGFIHDVSFQGQDLFPKFLEKISDSWLNGFTYNMIEDLNAVPLKYFHLLSHTSHPEGRAQQVKLIGDNIIGELNVNAHQPPLSLKDRNMDWYQKGVIPLLKALNSTSPHTIVTNITNETGITIESKAVISKGGIKTIEPEQAPMQVLKWTQIFLEHEKAVLKAALNPTSQNIKEALARDPLIPESAVTAIRQYIISNQPKKHEYANA